MTAKTTSLMQTLRQLLTAQAVHTQEEIRHALQELGFQANQSKISRCLHKIGAVKTRNEQGQIVYRLPKESAALPTSHTLSNLVLDVVNNEMLIIIHTTPGSASLVASVLDHNLQTLAILGTLAGDDTVMVVPQSIHQIQIAVDQIKGWLMNAQHS
jgi:transcriptional regulator of arginine metabolism